MVIEQKYHGHNVLNNIRMETVISGTIPDFSYAEKITIDDYTEEYKRVSPGRHTFCNDLIQISLYSIYVITNIVFSQLQKKHVHIEKSK